MTVIQILLGILVVVFIVGIARITAAIAAGFQGVDARFESLERLLDKEFGKDNAYYHGMERYKEAMQLGVNDPGDSPRPSALMRVALNIEGIERALLILAKAVDPAGGTHPGGLFE